MSLRGKGCGARAPGRIRKEVQIPTKDCNLLGLGTPSPSSSRVATISPHIPILNNWSCLCGELC